MKTYTAEVRRFGRWWAIDVPQVKGVHTQARRLDQVEYMARDAIAMVLEVPGDSFSVEVRPELGPDFSLMVARTAAQRQKAEATQRQASEALRSATRQLLGAGLSVRDAGYILGVSHQRVAQLAAAHTLPVDDTPAQEGIKERELIAAG